MVAIMAAIEHDIAAGVRRQYHISEDQCPGRYVGRVKRRHRADIMYAIGHQDRYYHTVGSQQGIVAELQRCGERYIAVDSIIITSCHRRSHIGTSACLQRKIIG